MNTGSRGNGWKIAAAALLGALGALALLPYARSTAASQVELALGRRPEWMRAASGGPSARLQRALAANPDDVALQVGAATLRPSEPDSGNFGDAAASVGSKRIHAVVLQRLNSVAERFPNDAAVRAHQLRYLIWRAVRIRSSEETEVAPRPARRLLRPQPPGRIRSPEETEVTAPPLPRVARGAAGVCHRGCRGR
jgi:hypothetical protein